MRIQRLRFTMQGMIVAVAISALASLGLARWLQYRRETDPWRLALRYASSHEASAREHLEAARRYPETAADRLRMAKFEKAAAKGFQLEADRLKP